MIYEPAISSNQQGETCLRRPFTREDVIFRPLIGLFLLGIGGLVLYMFATGGAPRPTGHGMGWIFGCSFVIGIFLLFGVMPVGLGIAALLRNDVIVVDSGAKLLEHRINFGGITVVRRRLSFAQFDAVTVEYSRGGFPVSRSMFTVVATGHRQLRIGLFYNAVTAKKCSDSIARLMHLPPQRSQESSGGPAVA